MTLYELTGEYLRLLEMLEDEDVSEEAVNDTLAMLDGDLEDKAEGYGKVLKQMQADREAIKTEKMRLAAREKAIDNGIDRLRERLKGAMLLLGKDKIKTDLFTFSTMTRLKTVIDVDEDKLPPQFQKVTVKADTKAIDEWLRAGHEEPWAHQEQAKSLVVR